MLQGKWLELAKRVIIAVFVFVLVVGASFGFITARTLWIEDHCVDHANKKVGDRWNEPIPTSLSPHEYYRDTGRKDFFGADYRETSLGWYEVFKCENSFWDYKIARFLQRLDVLDPEYVRYGI